jgi:hypothetical protein
MAMKVRRPAYSEVTDLDLRLYVLGTLQWHVS